MNECKITKDTGSLIKVIDDFNEFVKNNPKNK